MFLIGPDELLGQSKIDLVFSHELFSGKEGEKVYALSVRLSAVSEYTRISPMLKAFFAVC